MVIIERMRIFSINLKRRMFHFYDRQSSGEFKSEVQQDGKDAVNVDLVLTDPIMQGLGNTTDLGHNGFNGCPQGGILATVCKHHAYRSFTYFGGKLV